MLKKALTILNTCVNGSKTVCFLKKAKGGEKKRGEKRVFLVVLNFFERRF